MATYGHIEIDFITHVSFSYETTAFGETRNLIAWACAKSVNWRLFHVLDSSQTNELDVVSLWVSMPLADGLT